MSTAPRTVHHLLSCGKPAARLQVVDRRLVIDVTDARQLARSLPPGAPQSWATSPGFWVRYFARLQNLPRWADARAVAAFWQARDRRPARGTLALSTAPALPDGAPVIGEPLPDIEPELARAGVDPAGETVSVMAREPDEPDGHWALLRAATLVAASRCKVFSPQATVPPARDRYVVPRADRGVLEGRSANSPTIDAAQGLRGFRASREEEGGPGLAECLAFVCRHSSAPAVDAQHVVRWFIFSTLVGDERIHAGHVALVGAHGASAAWRLAPFAGSCAMPALTLPGHVRPARGFRIGGEFADDWPSADRWAAFAEAARLQSRTVFSMLRDMARLVPLELRRAIVAQYRTLPSQGPAFEVMRAVEERCDRMADLVLAVDPNAAGAKRPDASPDGEPAQ